MSTLPTYTEAEIRRHAGPEIFERGRDYYDIGMVQQLLLRSDTLTAEVEGWPATSGAKSVRKRWQPSGGRRTFLGDTDRAEIFLSEALWDDAIHAVDGEYGSEALIMVMKQVYQQRPDWVVCRASKFAENITDAVNWLAQAKQAYLAAGRGDEWRRYLEGVRSTHQQKYKLMGLLKRL